MDPQVTSDIDNPFYARSFIPLDKYRSLMGNFLREHIYFLIAVTVYVFYVFLIAWYNGVADRIQIGIYTEKFFRMIFIYLLIFLVGHATYVMIFIRPDRLTRYILSDLRNKYFTFERILNAIPVIILFQFFISAYTSFKAMIPVINPYSWDTFFIRLDAVIHFGKQPWQFLHPFLGYPLLTYLINFMYNLWFFVIIFFLYQQIFSLKDQKLRMQFLLATIGVWSILGGFLATFFSSVGPCFYGKLSGDYETYGHLMQYLSSAAEKYDIFALGTQDYLWETYISNKMGLGSGISAMPSMHVSKIFLVTLLAWKKNQILGAIFSVYTLLIMIGSVHLAWHYAVDGYLSIIATLIIWLISGRIIKNIKFSDES